MASEPLLALLFRKVQGGVGLELGFKAPIVVSAYADDVSVLVKNNQNLQAVMHALHVHQRALSSKVNWGKSGVLLCGDGSSRVSHSYHKVWNGTRRG